MFEQKTVRQMQDEKFNWFANKGYYKFGMDQTKDISISKLNASPSGKTRKRFNIIFRNKCHTKFGQYVDITVYKNRVYFRASSAENHGFKLYGLNSKVNPNTNINENEVTAVLKDFVGDYELRYDHMFELWYVEKEEVNE